MKPTNSLLVLVLMPGLAAAQMVSRAPLAPNAVLAVPQVAPRLSASAATLRPSLSLPALSASAAPTLSAVPQVQQALAAPAEPAVPAAAGEQRLAVALASLKTAAQAGGSADQVFDGAASPEGMARAIQFIQSHQKFLVLGHTQADGDAAGSALGMAAVLKSLGKEAVPFLDGGAPKVFNQALPDNKGIESDLSRIPQDVDAAIIVDAHDLAHRLGQGVFDLMAKLGLPKFVVDHHVPVDPTSRERDWVEDKTIAAAQMVTQLAMKLGLKLDKATAEALYLGLYTDSGGFMYPPIAPTTFQAAAWLLQFGVDAAGLAQRIEWQLSSAQVSIYRTFVQKTQRFNDGAIVLTVLTQEDFKAAHAEFGDAGFLATRSYEERDCRVQILARQQPDGKWHVSLRSKAFNTVDVVPVAKALNPKCGGHKTAAGAIIEGSDPEEVAQRILAAVRLGL